MVRPDARHKVQDHPDRLAVHGHDHVVGGQQPNGGSCYLGQAHSGGLVWVDPQMAEGGGYCRRLGYPHQVQVEDPILVSGPITEDQILLEQGQRTPDPGLQVLPAVDRGVLLDRGEVHLADRLETLAHGDDHPVAQRLNRPGAEHEIGQPHERQEQGGGHPEEHQEPNQRPWVPCTAPVRGVLHG